MHSLCLSCQINAVQCPLVQYIYSVPWWVSRGNCPLTSSCCTSSTLCTVSSCPQFPTRCSERTSSRPLLLGHRLSSRPCDIQVLEPVLLSFVGQLMLGVQRPQLSDCSYPRRVVGGDRGTLEALVHDVGSDADALGVVGGVEDAAGRLWVSERIARTVPNSAYLHQVQYSCPWDRHRCAVVLPSVVLRSPFIENLAWRR